MPEKGSLAPLHPSGPAAGNPASRLSGFRAAAILFPATDSPGLLHGNIPLFGRRNQTLGRP